MRTSAAVRAEAIIILQFDGHVRLAAHLATTC